MIMIIIIIFKYTGIVALVRTLLDVMFLFVYICLPVYLFLSLDE